MGLQTNMRLNIDFYDTKYILINAKQYDDASRWITIACYNQGEVFNLSSNTHTAYIRYKKADGNGVLNSCKINYKGEVLVELTEQMLAASGICYVDLIIVNKGSAIVDIDTGKIITVDNSPILSTMAFCINVYETTIDNSVIESSYEFGALNDALQKANADYTEIIQLSKSYAIGNAGGIRENEDNDNSKYYSQLALENANSASASAASALASAESASESEEKALESANNASESAGNALMSEESALESANKAANSENTSKDYAESSENSMNSALASASAASASEVNANASASSALESASSALESATNASESEESALESANRAANSEANALMSANSILDSVTSASESATIASKSASSALESANSASESENAIKDYMATTEDNMNTAVNSATSASESAANAYNYYLQVEEITTGLSGAFMPMGTIEYSELATLIENGEVKAGCLYNISDNFVTDETFKKGAGVEYSAGTNVYYTSDGYWDCLAGTTVTGVKGGSETEYRKGNVNITVENIGAISSADIATVDEVKNYLGI